MRALDVLVIALCLLCGLGDAYRHGDPVNALKRSQYKGYRTEWSAMPSEDIPRFGIDRTIRLVPADAQRIYESDQPFKLSFSFDHDRFLSTWITVNDGAGNYLHYIEFEFVYSGDHIQQLKWSVAYQVPDRKGVKPEHIFLRYRWVPFVETDAALGLDTLFLVASLTAWGVILMVLFRMDKVKRSDAKEN